MSNLIYVEYDETGELTSVSEVFVGDGPDVPPLVPEPLEEPKNLALREAQRNERRAQRARREARLKEIRAERLAETRAALEERASGSQVQMLVLPEGSPLPEMGGRHYLSDDGVLTRRTDEEMAAVFETQA